jgi:hypothetical protein
MPKRAAKKQPVQEVTAQVRLSPQTDTPSYYVNYIGVTHTAYDFTLSAVRIPTPFTDEQIELAKNGQQIPVEPIVQLVIPASLVDGLMKALTDQKERHAKTLEQQVKNNELQQPHIKPLNTVH